MAEERKYSPNYNWALPLPQGNQIVEITQIGDTITAIDKDFKAFVDAYNAHKHRFRDLEELPSTLDGYGITDAMTTEQVGSAISESGNSLSQSFSQALSSLSETIMTALGFRVRVDAAQDFTLAQKKRARDNIEAVGVVDKGASGGVAPLGSDGKIASTYLPPQTTTATVGAAVAGANGGASIADGDTLTGVLSGTSTLQRWTWGNIKAWLKAYFDPIYQKALGFTPVRQFSAGVVSIGWGSGLELNVDATWFGNNWPISISGRANGGANWADGATYADRLGSGGWTLATIQDQLNWRVTDSRFAGYFEQSFNIAATSWSEVVPGASGYIITAVWTWAPKNMTFAWRQPQIYIPNVGWRALGGW